MPEAGGCYGFPQAFSLSLHKELGSGALLAGAEPQPWPGCAAVLPMSRGGLALGWGAFLPIRASFCFSPAAGGLGWGDMGLLPLHRPGQEGEGRPSPKLTLHPASRSHVSFRSLFSPQTTQHPPGTPSPRSPCWCGAQGLQGTDLDQVGGEALGPQPLLEAVRAAQGALQAAGLRLQQGGADALVGLVVPVLGGQPGDVDQPPALGIVSVVTRVAEQVAGGQL